MIQEIESAPECGFQYLDFPQGKTTVVGVSHSSYIYEPQAEFIKKAFNETSFVAIEADPIMDTQLLRSVDFFGALSFFRIVREAAWELGLPLVYVDPQDNMYYLWQEIGLAAPFLYSMLRIIPDERVRVSRRKFFLNVSLAGASLIPASQVQSMQELTRSTNCQMKTQNPLDGLAYLDFRNSGSILGLRQAYEHEIISGNGAYIVGKNHVAEYVKYSRDIELAKWQYSVNFHQLVQNRIMGHPQIRLWQPGEKPGEYNLVASETLVI